MGDSNSLMLLSISAGNDVFCHFVADPTTIRSVTSARVITKVIGRERCFRRGMVADLICRPGIEPGSPVW